jgi:RHS repeat-associated protein
MLMVTNLVTAGAVADRAIAQPDGHTDLRTDRPVPVTAVEPGGEAFVDPSADQVWEAGSAATNVPGPASAVYALDGDHDLPEGFPVLVRPPSQHPRMPTLATSTGSVRVTTADGATTEAAGVEGLLVSLSGAGRGPADLAVDYSTFADRYGGGWASRLRVVELPECAAITPQAPGCLTASPVDSHNDRVRQTVSTRVNLDGGDRVFAVMADSDSEGAGDYRATDLSPAGSWVAGGNDGAFTYGYPLRVPPAAGPVPTLSLGYSSASHDGRTSGQNNQASWVGDGWDYDPGFVERSYKPCLLDDGGNTPDLTGDLCWDRDGASITMSLSGTNTTLVRDDSTGNWRADTDANWRVEHLGSPASNNGATSERWKVTTPDGTQYWFASEVSTSNSRWTAPVFGNHSGEPCRSSSFRSSSCRQAYRWLLDKVVDVHGNAARYFYAVETGHYGAAGDPDNRVAYDRAGRLTRIEYGLRANDAGVPATGRVLFTAGNRCLSNCGTLSNPTTSNWPDTPWDLHCDAAPCTSQLSPTFFATQRLTKTTTQVRDGSGFRDVDSWTMEHDFKDYGDKEQVTLWLKSIQHTGHVGADVTLPKTVFGGEALPNRVDAAPGVPVMWRWRMASIKTETGGVITVDYAPTQCTPGNLPSPSSNTMRCYPVRWTPEFFTEPIQDWFHKHVVSSVVETDTTGGMVAVETYYEYATSGGGTSVLWAFDDSEFIEDKHRTYNQWRGYAQVTTRLGDPAQTQTMTRQRFYRGLDGQPLPSGGSRSVSVTDTEGNAATDHEALAGQVSESLSFNGSSVIEGSTFEYWTRRTASQSRSHNGGDLKAWLTGVSAEKTRTRLTSTVWQRAETRTSFDDQGRATQEDSLGDTGRSGDEYCTRTEYADNPTAWIKNAVKRSETVAVRCGASPSRPDDVVSDNRTFFDGSNAHGATPSKGLPTRVDTLDDWPSGPVYVTTARMDYDSLGRPVETTDALGHTSTTAYTPAGPGPLTRTVATNPLGHRNTTMLEPAWGAEAATVDPNGRRTDLAYDALGRSTAVWLPGRAKATQTASMRFEYLVRDNGPSAVTSRTLNHVEEYVTSVVLYDALLRERQTQTETGDRGRLVTETIYDTHGRVEEEFGPNHNLNPPNTTIVRVREEDSAQRTGYFYDAAGRIVNEVFYNKHIERWRTTTSYGGSSDGFMVTVRPPQGAPATATITDARGETIEKRTYRSNAPTGAYDALAYDYSPTGRLEAMTDQAGNRWSWEYDLRGRQVAAHDPDTGTSTMAYDAAGQVHSTIDARGERIVNDYDPLGRQTTRRDGDGTLLAEWDYDTAQGGIGMLGRATRWHDGQAYSNETLRVDGQGLVTLEAVTFPASQGRLAGRYFFTNTYAPNGLVAAQGLPRVGELEQGILAWAYDHVGNPTRLTYQDETTGATVIVDQATFTPYNEIQTRRLGAGNARHAYHGFVYEEDTRRLERATFGREASINSIADLRYDYDDAGNLLSISDIPEDLPGNHELQCFRYDNQRRLVESWGQGNTSACATTPSMGVLGGPAPYWHSYDHDVTGNRTTETLRAPGQQAVTRTYTYPAAGQPQPHTVRQVTGAQPMSFDYDAAGNTISRDIDGQVQTLTWDAEGRIETVNEPGEDAVRMIYDADGERLVRDNGDTVTAFLPQTELTWDRSTDTVEATRYFSHADQVVATNTGRDVADWTFLGVDHHGTTTTHAVNAFTGVEQVRRMDPYGNRRGPAPHAWPGQRSFVGGAQDPTGLIHIGARSYDPGTGRFISADPVLATDDGQQINGYTYAHNNPATFTDPTGLFTSVGGVPCIDGDCSYHNPDGSLKNKKQCEATGGCGRGYGSSTSARSTAGEQRCTSTPFGSPLCPRGGGGPGQTDGTPTPSSSDDNDLASQLRELAGKVGGFISTLSDVVSFVPRWVFGGCPVCLAAITGITIIGGILEIIGGELEKGIGTIIGAGLSVVLGRAGNQIAQKLSKEITPTVLFDLGKSAWKAIESGAKKISSMRWVPSKIQIRIQDVIEDATHFVSQFLSQISADFAASRVVN